MKASSIICLWVVALLTVGAHSEPLGEIGSGIAGLGNNIRVRIITKAEPPLKDTGVLRLSNRYDVGTGVLHRSVIDAVNHTYFGYDLYAEPAGATQCRVSILPLTSVGVAESHQIHPRGSASGSAGGGTPTQVDGSYRPVLLPRYPNPQLVSAGETVALDLLTSIDGRQKIVDYIEVSCRAPDAAH